MKKHLTHTIQILLAGISLTAFTVSNTGCKADGAVSTGSESLSGNSEIPALMDRKGELAKGVEWQRTKERVADLMAKIASKPSESKYRLQLATVYIAEARITGEHPYYYPAILKILDGVLAQEPASFEALVLKSSVKMSQHQFGEAAVIAEKALSFNPSNAYVYGVLVDAYVELGQYEKALSMSDKMQALKPSLESYSRASYLREIHGDYPGALEAMNLAVQAGLPGSEPECWSRSTLGYLYEKTGDLENARRAYEQILAVRPSYAFALKGLASVESSKKNYSKALELLVKASSIMPEFSFREKAADIYLLQGNEKLARQAYAEVISMLGEDERSGHTVNLELSRVYSKLGNYSKAKEYAMREYRQRPENIDVNGSLAWISFKEGDNVSAEKFMVHALRTGTKDPETLWRASRISSASGKATESERLLAVMKTTNSIFDPIHQ